jgi:linoleoyl-CoA desaturase
MGSHGILQIILIWISVILLASFLHGVISVNASHHHNQVSLMFFLAQSNMHLCANKMFIFLFSSPLSSKVFHDGDELKSMDFGIYQLAATFDRANLQKNHFVVLATFGHHIAHHLFPTLDHSALHHLNEIIFDVCSEFEAELVKYPWHELFIGQFRQLLRTQAHKL